VPEKRRTFDEDFRAGAVRNVQELPGKSIAQIVRELGINEGTLGNWVSRARETDEANAPGSLSESERVELQRLRRENARAGDGA